jgi:hypothetical protein
MHTMHHHPQPRGREDQNKLPSPALLSPTLCHATGVTRCRPEWPLELLHHGTITPVPQVHSRRSLRSIEALARTPVTTQGTPIDPGHSAWGPHLIHCLTLRQGFR